MKVLLINPPFMRFFNREALYPHIGLGYLGTYLSQFGHDVTIRNFEVSLDDNSRYVGYGGLADAHQMYLDGLDRKDHPVWKEVAEFVGGLQPEVVGITSRTVQVPSALRVAETVKLVDPSIWVTIGGVHATARPQDFDKPYIDEVVRGEGESSNWKILPQTKLAGMDSYPIPNRALFVEDYGLEGLGHMVTTRGCPFQCSFCAQSVLWGSVVRYRSPCNVLKEMRYLNSHFGVKDFTFWDDSFTIRRGRVLDLCDDLAEKHWLEGWKWRCDTRLDLLDVVMVQRMLYSGCHRMSLGVESGSPRVLEMVRKGETLEDIKEKTKLLRDARRAYPDFKWRIYLMTGFPTETEEEIQMTWDLAKELQADRICLSNFVYYPGTPIYEEAVQKGWIDEYKWEEHSHQTFSGISKEFAEWVDDYNAERGGWEGWKS